MTEDMNLGQLLRTLIVGDVTLFALYWIENYLSNLYGSLSPATVFGFIVMASITTLGLTYTLKAFHAEPDF